MKSVITKDRTKKQEPLAEAKIQFWQVIIVTAITAAAGLAGAVIQGYFSGGRIERLKTDLSGSKSKVEDLQKDLASGAAERDALYRLTANYLESDLAITSEKGGAAGVAGADVDYLRLRRAVFLNMLPLHADAKILTNTLTVLGQRGHDWILALQSRVVADFPEIRKIRLRWLEDVAIPALQEEIERTRHSAAQSLPSANVPIPPEIRVLKTVNVPTISVHNLNLLTEEVELLKQSV